MHCRRGAAKLCTSLNTLINLGIGQSNPLITKLELNQGREFVAVAEVACFLEGKEGDHAKKKV